MRAQGALHARPVRNCVAACIGLMLALTPAAWAAEPVDTEVPLELWDRPRSGRAVLSVPAVRKALAELVAAPDARVTIRHPPGNEALAQAEELRAWLVAHAIDADRIASRPDLSPRQPIRLEVAPPVR
jgi:hypothetical protein